MRDTKKRLSKVTSTMSLIEKHLSISPLAGVQEGVLGLDSVAHSRGWFLWRKLGYPFWLSPQFSGVELREIAHEMEHYLGREVKNIPTMKVNLLFQYKRPQYITMSSGSEWHLWNQKYFRYDLYTQQHTLLSHIETKFGNDAVVLYAAPSVVDVGDLVNLKGLGQSLITLTLDAPENWMGTTETPT